MEIKKSKFTFKSKELPFIPTYYSRNMYYWLECSGVEITRKIKKIESTKHFIELSKACFGPNAFDYSLCKFRETRTPVMLKCTECGQYFKVFPLQHLNGNIGCPECSYLAKIINNEDRLNRLQSLVKEGYRGLFDVHPNNDPDVVVLRCNACDHLINTTESDLGNNVVCPNCGINFEEDVLKPEQQEESEKLKRDQERKDYMAKMLDLHSKEILNIKNSINLIVQEEKSHSEDIDKVLFNISEPNTREDICRVQSRLESLLNKSKEVQVLIEDLETSSDFSEFSPVPGDKRELANLMNKYEAYHNLAVAAKSNKTYKI